MILDMLCGTIQVPKALVIRNVRLGLLLRILQVGALVWNIYSIFVLQGWTIVSVPMPHSLEVWTSPAAPSSSQPAYCTTPFFYQYSSSYTFNMTRCLDIPDGEKVSKLGTNLFVATSIQDQYITRRTGAAVCANLSTQCALAGGAYKSGSPCECSEDVQGFVSRPEDVRVHLNHGYMVNWPAGEKNRGVDKSQAQVKGSLGERWADIVGESGQMKTIVQGPGGKRCKVGADTDGGAKDEWQKKDVASDGMRVTIRELLACAGETLDDAAPSLASGLEDEKGQVRPRVAGMGINLDFSYHNKEDSAHTYGFDGVVCVLTVTADPRWNSATAMAYSVIPDTRTGVGEYRSRKAYGVSFTFQQKGSFAKFDIQALITLIVNSLVIFALPSAIVQFVALNLLGTLSEVYKRAQAQTLSIVKQFSGLTARMLAGVAAFETVSGEKDHVDYSTIKDRLRAAFNKPLTDGTLDEAEFKELCDNVLRDLDSGDTDNVTLDEFMQAYASEECVEPKHMVKFFDANRSRSPLEILFNPGISRRKAADLQKVRPEPSAEP